MRYPQQQFVGIFAGVCAGVFFKKLGYGLTHETKTQAAIGVLPTVIGILLLVADRKSVV